MSIRNSDETLSVSNSERHLEEMMEETDKHRAAYREEASELLSELERLLIDLEKTPEDAEVVGGVFRALHTIKGSGAMFGFDRIAGFTHEIETIFDQIRKGKITASKCIIDLTLAARDQIALMLQEEMAGELVNDEVTEQLILAFKECANEQGNPAPFMANEPEENHVDDHDKYTIYRIRFRPPNDLLKRGGNPLQLLQQLRLLGNCKAVAQGDSIPLLEDMDPEGCYTSWDIILTTDRTLNDVKDAFIFYESDSELKIEIIDDSEKSINELDYKKLGEILVERGDLAPEDLEKVLDSHKRLGEVLIENKLVTGERIEAALLEQQQVREARQRRQKIDTTASIRVPSNKLDRLVDLVGELVTVQARLSQAATEHNDTRLHAIAEEVERLTDELRDNTMSIRMLPIGTTFTKFSRLVRDLSHELGKEVEMTTEGAETELDKTVIERLNDPLVHIIRNCIDHGIELPETRLACGKPRQGTVHLSAVHSGGNVIIQIRDDGMGLDHDVIRSKAVEKGLVTPEAELSEKELYSFILAQGFSTAKDVTSVSGRGVGMDVVKRAIDALRGTIDINSQKGKGTTLTLRLPLTLAIIDGLLVRIAGQHFIFPLHVVEECIELTHDIVENYHGRHLINVRDHVIPYIHLREFFKIGGESPSIEQIVITETGGTKIGFVVDHVIGEHQTVIKTLGRVYKNVKGISGATILGDGTLALIVDIPRLAECIEQRELQLSYQLAG